ncbi:MAG: helicase-related protein [Thermogemmata sp.]|uniref:Helicase C-terminal domain-containing protein n=1 Tax=Thermogemmata fonticola TaxID=2755323 RepID=A0A7V8VBB3_9BACT|nr:helicase-related protein [Thermogemmata fonticola]MBA2224547.1 hypothetical protein [Thermogemmata fonticola]
MGQNLRDQRTKFRDELIQLIRRELIGPEIPYDELFEGKPPPTEVLLISPLQRYVAGVLFPLSQSIHEVEDFDNIKEENITLATELTSLPTERTEIRDVTPDEELLSEAYDETVRLANESFPSAIGLTFIAAVPEKGLVIRPRAAVYESRSSPEPSLSSAEPNSSSESKSKRREWWHRIQLDLKPVPLRVDPERESGMAEVEVQEHLKVRYLYHRQADGTWLITVTLFNTRQSSPHSQRLSSQCFFQVGFEVRSPDDNFVFREYRSGLRAIRDPRSEEARLELLYRNRKAFAVGHGCATDWGEERDGRTNWVATSIIPAFKVAPIEPRIEGGDELCMYFLSGKDGSVTPEEILTALERLPTEYERWILEREAEVPGLPEHLREAARVNIQDCRTCLERIRAGIALLRTDSMLLEAFMLANRAMLMQQYHSRRPCRGVNQPWEDLPKSYEPTEPNTGRWRAFQIAFILLNLRSLVPGSDGKDHPDRQVVDLIWFPTGGGKTEAYLGLSACDIFYRRLRNPDDAGCTVLMRYTLRLLTAQQFQRAATLICACELIRRESPSQLGEKPISIGLWVGESLTPIYRRDAVRVLNRLASDDQHIENPFLLLRCPWCGTELDNRRRLGYVAHGNPRTVIFVCPAQPCPFSSRDKRLPVLVIDEDIYDQPPTLLIGTVDKFAMLAWREGARSIFGLGKENYNPPDLIIQDELHLISGPLGSVVGLYEGVIDLLCSWRGRPPKIIASTATIRRASQQCLALYNRPIFQFPPQGTDISDCFFAQENHSVPGRIYVGVFANAATSFLEAMVRALSALFQGCRTINLPEGASEDVRDPYWTIVQYFNNLRELGQAATLVETDIPDYINAIANRDKIPKELRRLLGPPVELTSRLSANEIPQILEQLNVTYPPGSAGHSVPPPDTVPLDAVLATNIISVGVDVNRLGLIVIVGQPMTTSEYIQVSSRIGRSDKVPGLVVTMYNPGRPRDRSHYEHFRSYHAAFYKYVEPTSVTPYSLPVQERVLHALLVIVARHLGGLQNPNQIDPRAQMFVDLISRLQERCNQADPDHAEVLQQNLQRLLDHWYAIRPSQWGRLGQPPEERPLMYPTGIEPRPEWRESAWATMTSMRNVDIECQLQVVCCYPDPDSCGDSHDS